MLDPALAGVDRSSIQTQLRDVGFDDERQRELVGGLSGGWKMKLELARAMLYKADLLLLDEVRIFHAPSERSTDSTTHTAYQPCAFYPLSP